MKLPSGIRCLTFAQSNERSHSSGLVRVCVCVCVAHTIKTNAIHAKQTRVSVWSFIPSTAHRSACRPGCMCYLALCFRSLFPMAALLPHVCSLSLASESFVVRMRFSLRRIALCRMPHFEERPTARNTYTRMQKQKIVHVLVCTPHPIQLEQQQRWMNACVCVCCLSSTANSRLLFVKGGKRAETMILISSFLRQSNRTERQSGGSEGWTKSLEYRTHICSG